MSVELFRGFLEKFDSRILSREILSRWIGRNWRRYRVPALCLPEVPYVRSRSSPPPSLPPAMEPAASRVGAAGHALNLCVDAAERALVGRRRGRRGRSDSRSRRGRSDSRSRRGFAQIVPGPGCSGSALGPRRPLPPARTPCRSTSPRLPARISLALARALLPRPPSAARGFASSAGCPAPQRGRRLLACAGPRRLSWPPPLPLTPRPALWSARLLLPFVVSGRYSPLSLSTASS